MSAAETLIAEYRSYLADNRRRSPHSVRAYVATAERLTLFLTEHFGQATNRTQLAELGVADLRAFLAFRRGDGITNRSTARELSAVRSFCALHLAPMRQSRN
jgi:integrase/recombinase XerC